MDPQIKTKLEQTMVGSSKRQIKVTVTDGKEFEKTVEGLSFKKIIKGLQGSLPAGTQYINVHYTNRKGTLVDRDMRVPIGRRKKRR
jgi:FKBP-type peptidyl-prolyl cis-trans isomerase